MSFRLLTLTMFSLVGLAAFHSSPAVADKASAAACAAKLPKDARMIYDASAPDAAGSANLKDVLTQKTRSLAMAGQISRSSARASAESAGACLKLAAS